MPPRLPRSIRPLTSQVSKRSLRPYVCASCTLNELSRRTSRSARPDGNKALRLPRLFSRHASILSSATAINAVKEVRPAVRELYDALVELRNKAPVYVNLSRLQLALNGLESEHAVVRVAVLGVNGHAVAARLVRALLADPLAEEQEWERTLERLGKEGRAVLIKYGDTFEVLSQNALLTTLAIPRMLRANNLEILISRLNTTRTGQDGTSISPEDAILVTTLEAPSGTGHFSIVRYPVHRSVVVAEGLDNILSLARYTSRPSQGVSLSSEATDLIHFALSVPSPQTKPDPRLASPDPSTTTLDPDLAIDAITSVRSSPSNAIAYEQDWFRSNLPRLSSWLTSSLTPTSPLKPPVTTLITSLLASASQSLSAPPPTTQPSPHLSPSQRTALQQSLSRFSTRAHTSLLTSLDLAFDPSHSPLSSLPFYLLPLRIDDLPLLTASLLTTHFLVAPEKEYIFLLARLHEAGYFSLSPPTTPLRPLPAELPIRSPHAARPLGSPAPNPTMRDLLPSTHPLVLAADTNLKAPWTTPLALARAHLLTRSIPPLHAAAQRLVLAFFSTTTVSGLLGALVYVSSLGVYEASALAALGVVVSLRRLQRGWSTLRSGWEADVREEGRRALREAEDTVVRRVEEVERERVSIAEEREAQSGRREASEALERARAALEKLVGSERKAGR